MTPASEMSVTKVPELGPVLQASEYVTSIAPFTVRRTIRWAECDPAGVVYVGNFPNYLLSTVHLFRDHLFGPGWIGGNARDGFQAPGKALSMVFQSSLWPDDTIDMRVFVGAIRKRTIELMVQAKRADNNAAVFVGSVTSIFVEKSDRTASLTIPDAVRRATLDYREVCPAPPDLAAVLLPPS